MRTGPVSPLLFKDVSEAFALAPLKVEGDTMLFDNSEFGRARHAQFLKRSDAARKGWVKRKAVKNA